MECKGRKQMKLKLGWYIVKKNFRGGSMKAAVKMTKKLLNDGYDTESLMRSIGDGTDGGGIDGYIMSLRYSGKTKPKKLPTLTRAERIYFIWKEERKKYGD